MRDRLATPVDDFAQWMLVAGCAKHGTSAYLVSTLMDASKSPTTLGALAYRANLAGKSPRRSRLGRQYRTDGFVQTFA